MNPYIACLTWVVMGGNIIIDFNASHHSNHLRLLICYTGPLVEKKTVEFVSVAIFVRSYRLNTVLQHRINIPSLLDPWSSSFSIFR